MGWLAPTKRRARRRRRRSRRRSEQPTLFSALDLDVTLAVPDNMVVRGNDLRPANAPIDIGDMNVTVGGELRLRKAAGGELSVVGDVDTVRGSYNFQGRRFEILRDGHIRFDGTDELNPAINIRARRIISGVETFVRVQGTLKQPELSFSSNPPLDQADILSLIVFNTPINELGEGQQVSLDGAGHRPGRRVSGHRSVTLDQQRAPARRIRDSGGGARVSGRR